MVQRINLSILRSSTKLPSLNLRYALSQPHRTKPCFLYKAIAGALSARTASITFVISGTEIAQSNRRARRVLPRPLPRHPGLTAIEIVPSEHSVEVSRCGTQYFRRRFRHARQVA